MSAEDAALPQVARAVTFFVGARDHYQLPLALSERDWLEAFVTEMYWPFEHRALGALARRAIPVSLRTARHHPGLPSSKVRIDTRALAAIAVHRLRPRWNLFRISDRALGATGRRIAARTGASVFSYSYYVHEAFRHGPDRPDRRFIFQLHPHPLSVRRILNEELERYPWATASLRREEELGPNTRRFEELCDEPGLANGWVAASSFTARTLAENGVPLAAVHVVPYGVERATFPERPRYEPTSRPLEVVFVGSIIQRKGLCDLLEAMRLLGSKHVHLTLAGRGFIDRPMLQYYRDVEFEVAESLNRAELVQLLHRCDLFVLPSLVEGFGHVVLEAMSTGLPVLASQHSCAVDLVREGVEGWVVPIRSPEAIAQKLAWAAEHRAELAEMGAASAAAARALTWERFRQEIRAAYIAMVKATSV